MSIANAGGGRRYRRIAPEIRQKAPNFPRLPRHAEAEGPRICLIATPDHWHALAMIEAVKSGADVYVQKPISVDVVEGQAMVAAARKYKRVVQVGTQRRSTPHLVEAKEQFVDTGRSGRSAWWRSIAITICGPPANPPDTAPPANLDYEMWTGPAPMRPYCSLMHPRTLASVHGIRQRHRGRHGDPHVRHDALDAEAGMARACDLDRRHSMWIRPARPISPTRKLRPGIIGDLKIVWQHRTWGAAAEPDRYGWGATFYGDKGTLKAGVYSYDFIPTKRASSRYTKTSPMNWNNIPKIRPKKDLERHVAPAVRHHMLNLLQAIDNREQAGGGYRAGLYFDCRCILANLAMKTGRKFTWDAEKQQVTGDDLRPTGC